MAELNSFIVVIPARLKSERLPGKPLIDLGGKSMIRRTWDQCRRAVDAKKIYVATEDDGIVEHCKEHGIQVILTKDTHLTGTDRVAEVATRIEADFYINVQGDEPLFNPDDITLIVDQLARFDNEILNGYTEIKTEQDYFSATIPKVVFRPDGRLMYMSRSSIPGNKLQTYDKAWRQVCVYAFPRQPLLDFHHYGRKSTLEAVEDIEILRFLEMGYEVRMIRLSDESIAVDTSDDAEKVMNELRRREII